MKSLKKHINESFVNEGKSTMPDIPKDVQSKHSEIIDAIEKEILQPGFMMNPELKGNDLELRKRDILVERFEWGIDKKIVDKAWCKKNLNPWIESMNQWIEQNKKSLRFGHKLKAF